MLPISFLVQVSWLAIVNTGPRLKEAGGHHRRLRLEAFIPPAVNVGPSVLNRHGTTNVSPLAGPTKKLSVLAPNAGEGKAKLAMDAGDSSTVNGIAQGMLPL